MLCQHQCLLGLNFTPKMEIPSKMSHYIEAPWELYNIWQSLGLIVLIVFVNLCKLLSHSLESCQTNVWYLSGTIAHGICISASSQLSLHGYCDADWSNDIDDRRSTSVCLLVFWWLPHIVELNETHYGFPLKHWAEYRSLANATSELLWIQSLITELRVPCFRVPTLR